MAHFDARKEGPTPSEFLKTSPVADSRAVAVTSEQTLLSGQAAQFVFRAPGGSVVILGGIDGAALRELVDQAEHIPDDRRALFVRMRPAGSVEAYVDQVIAVLAETAMCLWPVWFTDVELCDVLRRRAWPPGGRRDRARGGGSRSRRQLHLGGSGGTPCAGWAPAARSWRSARGRAGAAFTRRQPRRPRFCRRCERGGGCTERRRPDACAGMDRAALARRRGRPVRQGAAARTRLSIASSMALAA